MTPDGYTTSSSTLLLTIDIPKSCWMSSNRMPTNPKQKARYVRDIQDITRDAAVRQHFPAITGPVHVDWTVCYPKGSAGDSSNAQPTTKAALDAIVHAGYLEDDGPKYVVAETFRRGVNLKDPGVHRIVALFIPQNVPWVVE